MDVRKVLYRGAWYAVWREDGETRRKALRTRDPLVADSQLAAFRARQSAPEPQATAGTIFARYLAEKGKPRAHDAWRRLAPYFEHRTPPEITAPACRAYCAARARDGASTGTIWTELTFLRAALRWGQAAPPATVELPPKPPPRDLHLTRDQFDRLLDECHAPHLRLFLVLALATAGRRAAILELTWDRVDFERGLIRLGLGEKRRKGRATVPMTARARAVLEEAWQVRTTPTVIAYGGRSLASVRPALARAAERAGLPWVTPHVMRHTAAVWMAEAGVTMPEIAAFLGHTDSRTTERIYARFTPDYLRRAAQALD